MSTLSATSFSAECASLTMGGMARTKSENAKKMATVSARVEQEQKDTLEAMCEAIAHDQPFKPTTSQLVAAAVKEYIERHAAKILKGRKR